MRSFSKKYRKVFLFLVGLYFFIKPQSVSAIGLQRPPYVQDVTTSSAYVLWKTDTQGSCELRWGQSTSYGQTATGQQGRKTIDNSPGFICKVKIENLSPNTIYYYQVVSSGTTLTPSGDQSYHIKTAPTGDTPFTFAILGDPGDGSSGQQKIRDKLLAKNPDFFLIDGDIVYNYGDGTSSTTEGKQDPYLFDMYAQLMKNRPVYATCGNHDRTGCTTFVDETQLPQNGKAAGVDSTYSFNWGNHLFVALNSNATVSYNSSSPGSSAPQMAWAYNTIKNSTQKWTNLYWHHNCWSRGSHSTGSTMCAGPVKLATDLGVDVGHWGHTHVEERFSRWPANGGSIFYSIGNSGHDSGSPSCGPYAGGPSSVHCSKGEFGFLFVEVNGDTATYNYVTDTGANQESVTYRYNEAVPQSNLPPITPVVPTPTTKPSPSTSSQPITADIIPNGCVDIFDFNALVANFGKTGSNIADIDKDGDVDIFDFNRVVSEFGRCG